MEGDGLAGIRKLCIARRARFFFASIKERRRPSRAEAAPAELHERRERGARMIGHGGVSREEK